jgi:(R,R)-butanediol dehydrogenase/meso-butanediol dehydrogenase/diacetyl reductase
MGVHEHPDPVDFTDIVFGEKTLVGSMGGYGVFDEAIAQVAAGNLWTEPLITGRIGLENIVGGGFEALLEEKDRHAKILVSPA